MMAASPPVSATPGRNKPLIWGALVLLAIAAIIKCAAVVSGKHVPFHDWALLIGLALAIGASLIENRNTRNLLSGLSIGILIAAIYGILKASF